MEVSMEATELLQTAWEAVQESGVPPELYEIAFTTAVAHLLGTAPTPPTPAPTRPGGGSGAGGIGAGGSDGAGSGSTGTDAIYSRLSAESGVDEGAIREVILIEDDGTVALLTPGRQLGSSNAARARNVASLVAGVYFGGMNKRSVPLSTVREACDDRGCYDHKNFKPKHIGNHDALSVRNSDVHINQSKWVTSFEAAIDQARGVS